MLDKILKLRQYAQFGFYTVNENYVLQLFELDTAPNDIDASCIWENDSKVILGLLDEAIAWCEDQLSDN